MGRFEMKNLSFIIPLYNSAKWLEKCLCSVLNQDLPEEQMEIICVNDGSPDNSAELAREIGKKHPSIIVIDQPNQGPSGARNTGMKAATGMYLCFVDPDDFVEPNVYGKLVQQMEDEQLDMLRFNYQIVDERYRHMEKRGSEELFDYSPKLMSGAEFLATRLDINCNIWRYIYRREIITENGLWLFEYGNYDDTPWLPLVLLKAERMNICDTVVYDYLERSDSLVRNCSEKMNLRKVNGAIQLTQQFSKYVEDIESNKILVLPVWKQGVIEWYRSIQAYAVISYLYEVSSFFYNQRSAYLQKLKSLPIFPLSLAKATYKTRRKLRLINLSPRLYLFLLHTKNH